MKTLPILFIAALIGALLAVLGTTAVVQKVNPTAAQVAKRQASETGYNPAQPPPFYGSR